MLRECASSDPERRPRDEYALGDYCYAREERYAAMRYEDGYDEIGVVVTRRYVADEARLLLLMLPTR